MQANLSETTDVSNQQHQLVQYHGIKPSNHGIQNEPMELESYMSQVIKNIGAIGDFCRGQFDSISTRMTQLQDDGEVLERAVSMLANRSDAIAEVSTKNNTTMELLSQAIHQIIWKLNEIDKRTSQGSSDQISVIRDLKVSKELVEDKIKKLELSVEKLNSNFVSASSLIKNLMTKNQELEDSIRESMKKGDELEDAAKVQDSKTKNLLKSLNDLGNLPEQIRAIKRDQLGYDQDLDKMNKALKKAEEKFKGLGDRQQLKSDLSKVEDLSSEVHDLKDKYGELKIMVETVNEDAILKRLKKDLDDSNQSEFSKILKNIKNLEDDLKGHYINNDKLSKLSIDLKKKIEGEMKRIDELKSYKESENVKWNSVNENLEQTKVEIDKLSKKINSNANDVLKLEAEVFDYSFKEFTNSFNERVDNRLIPLRNEIQDMTKFINKVSSSFDTPLEKILETVKKMVDNKLDGFTDSIDQKLIHLANSKNISPQVPSKSLDGKQILYKINDKVIDPDKLQASIDGKIKIKWCKFQNQCKILSCKFYHESELCPNFKNCCSPTCYFRHPCAKLEDKKKRMWNNSQSSNSNSRKYFSARVNGTSKSIGSQPDKEQTSDNFIPFNSSKQGTKSTAPFRSHSFHQPPLCVNSVPMLEQRL